MQNRDILFSPCQPNSEKTLFHGLKSYISAFDPVWHLDLEPASKEHINHLERLVKEQYNQQLPLAYKMYLEKMGRSDGGLLSRELDYSLGDWNYFKISDMAAGAVSSIKRVSDGFKEWKYQQIPPFWYFFYAALREDGYGFSPQTSMPNQIIATIGRTMYYTHDTFAQLLFYCAYRRMLNWVNTNGKIIEYCEDQCSNLPNGTYSLYIDAEVPDDWTTPDHALLINFLEELESAFTLTECWFSRGKEFNLFDLHDKVTGEIYTCSRYVSFSSRKDLTICIRYFDSNEIGVNILSSNMCCLRQIVQIITGCMKRSEEHTS